MRKSDWMKGLQQAEKDYASCTDYSNKLGKYLHRSAISFMNDELEIDINYGLESDDYYEGYSDFIWQKEYNRFDRGIK